MNEVPRWRRIVGTILLVVGCVLVPVSLSAVWVRNTLLDTDNYVSTVGPLASESAGPAGDREPDHRCLVQQRGRGAEGLRRAPVACGVPGGAGRERCADGGQRRGVAVGGVGPVPDAVGERRTVVPTRRSSRCSPAAGAGCRPRTAPWRSTRPRSSTTSRRSSTPRASPSSTMSNSAGGQASSSCCSSPRTSTKVQGLVDLLQTLAWVLPFVALACFAGAIGLSGNRRRTIRTRRHRRRLRGRAPIRAPQGRTQPLSRRGHHQEVDAGRGRCGVGPAHELPAHRGVHRHRPCPGDRVRRLGRRAIVRGDAACAAWWHRTLGTSNARARMPPGAGARGELRRPLQDAAARHRCRDRIRRADRLEPPDARSPSSSSQSCSSSTSSSSSSSVATPRPSRARTRPS